ncbi:hypothetical protein GCM10014715_02450 [Streptomyces spiralis]|uniref:Uncharacterized protein n=1 Tax=Streptomyces spiralis TaxID=66376 RepID=A0A919DKD0_9ACTN|nr:hypothetical protein GCM10014715_02450 [Streptomyces spiralis]
MPIRRATGTRTPHHTHRSPHCLHWFLTVCSSTQLSHRACMTGRVTDRRDAPRYDPCAAEKLDETGDR